MTDPEFVSYDKTMERKLYVLSVDKPEQVPEKIVLSSPRFVCLIAWNAFGTPIDIITQVVRKLLDSGAVYICVWGTDCERVHDAIDEVFISDAPPQALDKVVMTTWHDNESLSEVIWFALHTTWPDEAYELGCNSTLGLSIGSPTSAVEIRKAFSEPDNFITKILASE